MSFRPLTGLSLYLHGNFSIMHPQKLCFRPLTGLSLYLQYPQCILQPFVKFPSPHGVISISTWFRKEIMKCQELMFPSPHGVISISTRFWWKGRWKRDLQFPSPHGVISISTVKGRHDGSPGSKFPSPHGVISISTDTVHIMMCEPPNVSVPSRGYLYIYPILARRLSIHCLGFRPLTGLSLYLPMSV